MAAAAKPALHEPEHLRGTTLDNLHFPKVVIEGFSISPITLETTKKDRFFGAFHVPLVWAPSGAQAQGSGSEDTKWHRSADAN